MTSSESRAKTGKCFSRLHACGSLVIMQRLCSSATQFPHSGIQRVQRAVYSSTVLCVRQGVPGRREPDMACSRMIRRRYSAFLLKLSMWFLSYCFYWWSYPGVMVFCLASRSSENIIGLSLVVCVVAGDTESHGVSQLYFSPVSRLCRFSEASRYFHSKLSSP